MERLVDHKYSELISAGFDILPPGIASRLRHTHFFTGTSPIYAGLITNNHKSKNNQSYHKTWCVSYSFHQRKIYEDNRHTTIVLPEHSPRGYPVRLLPILIVHELSHVLHEILGFEPTAEPVTKYAEIDRWEAFAEAFTTWLNPEYNFYYNLTRNIDEGTLNLFRELEELWR